MMKKNRNLSLDAYLYKTETYLGHIIIHLRNSDTWKIKLTFAINFIYSKRDAEKEHVMHSRSDNIKFTSYNDANEIADELFETLCSRYQGNLETTMRESDLIFHSVQMKYYKCHKVNFKCGGSHIDSSDWIKRKEQQ